MATPHPTPVVCVWQESTGHLGPFGGCTLSVYERDAEDGPAIWSRSFRRQIGQITPRQRGAFERIAKAEARAFMAECAKAND